MIRNITAAIIALLITSFVFAQVSTTPEVPRNYKPSPKELLPMPDSLTNEAIFPVLGKYTLLNSNGDSSDVYITLDTESKGVIWVSGLSEGKFKASLKASPATYRIPAQKTLFNDAPAGEEMSSDATTEVSAQKPATKKFSGKSVNEGTLIYDKEANQIYINLGSKFNESNPALIFEGLRSAESMPEGTTETSSAKNKKKAIVKGKNYTGSKVLDSM